MTEAIDAHVLKKYEIQQKLGKGVSAWRRMGMRVNPLPGGRGAH